MAIPEVNPVNNFGGTPVFEGAANVASIAAQENLDLDGSTYLQLDNTTGGALDVYLPFGLTSAGAITHLPAAGMIRSIINASGADAETLLVKQVTTVNSSGIPTAGTTRITLDRDGGPAGPFCATLACNGQNWFVASKSLQP